ncbi:MAG TPA: PP2C family protein-serine/threonine phosphatase [Solirubrobacteraceae bacterium]|nr:PP2C family protein-serine/threonine phosphatase [Solirubrobacteraceae bacterium]
MQSVDRSPGPAAEEVAAGAEGVAPERRSRAALWLPVATLIIGLALTVTLSLVSQSQYTNSEKRLLALRVRDASLLVTAALPSVQTSLASVAELADATNGNLSRVDQFASALVGAPASGKQFVSLSLWKSADPAAGPVAVLGQTPRLASAPARAAALFASAMHRNTVGVTSFLTSQPPGLGYAYSAPRVPGGYVAYAETALPANRRSKLQTSNAFANLDYAIYFGASQRPQDLLVTNLSHFPAPSPSHAETVPFGDGALTLLMSSRVSLAGSLPHDLPWLIGIIGVLLSVAAALLTWRLTERRRSAEELAGRLEVTASENRRLYGEQRSIAQTLQHAMLPDVLPEIPGMLASARYEAGEQGVDIGGDWYDVIDLDGRRLLLVVGDVSGRGLKAASTMASLRYAIRAYAAESDPPDRILTKLSHLFSISDTGQLATVLCAQLDIAAREITVTSAGHLPPLLLSNGSGRYVEVEAGLPIGVEAGSTYTATTIAAPMAATFLAYTDGLVELRGESLDQGLERLRAAAAGDHSELPDLLGRLVTELPHGPSEDDIAIVGVRWTS